MRFLLVFLLMSCNEVKECKPQDTENYDIFEDTIIELNLDSLTYDSP
jgi:hypothetical protein